MRATTPAVLAFTMTTLGAAAAPSPDAYEAIRQSQYLLSELIDTKQYDRLNEAVTEDYVHDSRLLGADGSLTVGGDELTQTLRESIGNALTEHNDSNIRIVFTNDDGTSANSFSYVTVSQ